MPWHLQAIAIAAIVGAGLMSGLLFAFSLVVLRALRELPPADGMHTMQRINVLIVNPLFLLVFLGTTLCCAVLAVVAWRGLPSAGAAWLLGGAAAYLIGPLGVTLAFSVPLNNRLARVPAAGAAQAWPAYARSWLRWNHLRTLIGAAACAGLAIGLALAAGGQ